MKLIALLSGTTGALGAYLYLSFLGTTKWIGLAVFLSAVAALLLCFWVSWKQEKTIYELHEQLVNFSKEGQNSKFSTEDDSFACWKMI